MSNSSSIKSVIPASLAAVLLVFCFSVSTYAAHDEVVTFATGIVDVEEDGTVTVCVIDARDSDCEEGDFLVPSNGHGLLRSGQIELGDIVDVKIITDRDGHKHRGHVTVLK